ncbi:ubiquitin-like modifier-activating enzyme ATG7 [Tanacetum coccineum]
MAGSENGPVLQFVPFQSSVDEGFWHGLSSLKLNKLKTEESPVSMHLAQILKCPESLPTEPSDDPLTETSSGKVAMSNPLRQSLYTLEDCLDGGLDKQVLLIRQIFSGFGRYSRSGKRGATRTFLCYRRSYHLPDLRNLNCITGFDFPCSSSWTLSSMVDLRPASKWFTPEEMYRSFWSPFLQIHMRLLDLSRTLKLVKVKVISFLKRLVIMVADSICFFMSRRLFPNNPGWPLRNFLTFISARWNIKKVQFLCYRENHGFADLDLSLVGEALIQQSQAWQDQEHVPNAVGWELNKGKRVPRRINLSTTMDPTRMAISAADLNLKLMRWRALPSLDLNMLSGTKCLLLGAGTLGCKVAVCFLVRVAHAWGVRKITLVDSGKVAMSNPLRQSLYTLEDCLESAVISKLWPRVKKSQSIFPAVGKHEVYVVDGDTMPGNPGESRWLPTLLCANANKWNDVQPLGILPIKFEAAFSTVFSDDTRGDTPRIAALLVVQPYNYVNQVPPSGTGSGPGYVNQGPPSHSSTGYPAGTGYNNGGYASAVAAAAPEYPGQNSYRPLMNRLPPIQGGFADSGNYGPSSGYPTQPNMPPAGPRGPHGGMYQGGHPYY